MLNVPINLIKEKIIEKTGMDSKDLDDKIKAKLEQLSGLISEEGAAHIIANELGINLMQAEGLMKIKDLLPAMKNVEIVAKITRKFELRTFENEKHSGKFAKFVVGDETGTTMVVLWNDATEGFEDLKEDDVVKLTNVSVRDNRGRTEIHISESGNIDVNPDGVQVTVQDTGTQATGRPPAVRKKIKELNENDSNVEIFSTIVQVFDPKFFEVDSDSGKRIKREEGQAPPKDASFGAVLNLFVDDGSDNVRVVLWKNQIINLLKINEEELMKFRVTPSLFEPVKTDLLGMVVKLIGRVSKNEMFNRLEFIANVVLVDVNPDEEMKKLEKESQGKEKKEEKIVETPKKVEEAPKVSETEKPVQNEDKPVVEKKKPEPVEIKDNNDSESHDEELLSLEDLEDLEE